MSKSKKQFKKYKKLSADKNVLLKHKAFFSLLVIVILSITFVAFYPSIFNGWTNWDDDEYVLNNKDIQEISFRSLKNIFSKYYSGNWQPVTLLSYIIDYTIYEYNAYGYHITNLIFHLLNTSLVFIIILLISENYLIGFISALLFGIHPLHVESVAWISQRKDVLSLFFYLISILFYIYNTRKKSVLFYYLSLLLFLFSLLSKPMAVSLPIVLLLLDYQAGMKIDKKNLISKIPFFLLSLIIGVITIFTQSSTGATGEGQQIFHINRVLIGCYGIFFYLFKMIVPLKLSCFYPYPVMNNMVQIIYISALLGLIALIAIIIYSKNKIIIFCSLFFFVTILPVLQIIPIGSAIAADRYFYLPSIGVFYLIGYVINYLYYFRNSKNKYIRNITILLLIIFVLINCILTWKRCGVWKDSESLWTDVIKKYPNASIAYSNRGSFYSDLDRLDIALDDFNRALKIDANFADAYLNRSYIFIKKEKLDDALSDLNIVLKMDSKNSKAYMNRGIVYMGKGEYDKALPNFDKAIKVNQEYEKAYYHRGLIHQINGELMTAISDFSKAISIKPDFIEALKNRAETNYMLKNYSEAWNDIKVLENYGILLDKSFVENVKKELNK